MVTRDCGHKYRQVDASAHKKHDYDCGNHEWFRCSNTQYDSFGHNEDNFDCYQHQYFRCENPSDETKEGHQYGMYPCGLHGDYKCLHASSASSHPAKSPCPKKNGKACLYKNYRACSPHVHYYDY